MEILCVWKCLSVAVDVNQHHEHMSYLTEIIPCNHYPEIIQITHINANSYGQAVATAIPLTYSGFLMINLNN